MTKISTVLTVAEIARTLGASLIGRPDVTVRGINETHCAEPGDLTYADNEAYFTEALKSRASVILTHSKPPSPPDDGRCYILVDDPIVAFNQLLQKYCLAEVEQAGAISKYAHVSSEASIGEGCRIGPGCIIQAQSVIGDKTWLAGNVFIGSGVTIGRECRVHPNVTIYSNVTIGDRCMLHSNLSIGVEAFTFARKGQRIVKRLSVGGVRIGQDVEILSGCTIARGITNDTVIGNRVVIDCLVHVGHGVKIGDRTRVAAQTGIAGEAVIGSDCDLWGNAGVNTKVLIGDHCSVFSRATVYKNMENGQDFAGTPARERIEENRSRVVYQTLPDLEKRLAALELNFERRTVQEGQLQDLLCEVASKILNEPATSISSETRFWNDFAADSLQITEIGLRLEEKVDDYFTSRSLPAPKLDLRLIERDWPVWRIVQYAMNALKHKGIDWPPSASTVSGAIKRA